MRRKEFLAVGMAAAVGARVDAPGGHLRPDPAPQDIRSQFPRLHGEAFLNGGGGTPLSTFTQAAIERYMDVARFGTGGERGAWWFDVWDGIRGRFASLIGASAHEVAPVECTKAGEQIVLDGLPRLQTGGTVVTNDLHFQGSLHNLEGRRRAGHPVVVVRGDGSRVPTQRMLDAIDDRTALVTVSLVSNVTGHVEDLRAISEAAHRHGAVVFADIIQAAGIVPVDVEAMGVDVAACSTYKWLFGIHGAGLLYVAERHQGSTLPDTLWPGGARRLYEPFAESGEPGTLSFTPREDADRYRPGHVNYLGYAAADAGLRFIETVGVDALLAHSVALNRRIVEGIDRDRYEVLSPHLDRSPILSLAARDLAAVRGRLAQSDVVVSTGGDRHDLIRISPAIYNDESDVDRLLEVLNG